jgi:exodeoxyribonuclease VII large subunit
MQLTDEDLFKDSATELSHMRGAKIYQVAELTHIVKDILESNELLVKIWVRGEISNFTHHSSGHMYFSLKDKDSQLQCVMFKGNASKLKFEPKEGLNVLALGQITVYEPRGRYQLLVREMLPDGLGALYLEFLQLKEKLSKEGLFAPEHKKPIPWFPKSIGVITSPTGAAIRDIINVTTRRYPGVHLVIAPTRVQGDQAVPGIVNALELLNRQGKVQGDQAVPGIVNALELLNRQGKVDVIIVTRGGGSLEDLWAFNEEPVARAIFDSEIPVISAVGHETDVTIADFVADKRVPTPSAAAEETVPDIVELANKIKNFESTIISITQRILTQYRQKLDSLLESPVFKKPLDQVNQYKQRIDELITQLRTHISTSVKLNRKSLEALLGKLESLNPKGVLERGYSITLKLPDEVLIRTIEEVSIGDNVKIIVQNGELICEIKSIKKNGGN